MIIVCLRIVKLISPNLNYFVAIGGIMLYGLVYVRIYMTSDETYNYIRCYVSQTA